MVGLVRLLVVSGFSLAVVRAHALETRFDSGLLRNYAVDAPGAPAPESVALSRFLKKEYGSLGPGYQWKVKQSLADNQHSHHTFELFLGARRVMGRQLKVHLNHRGFVEYASSNFNASVSLSTNPPTEAQILAVRAKVEEDFQKEFGVLPGRVDIEPVIWVSAKPQSHLAFNVRVISNRQGVIRNFILEETSLKLLQRLPVARFANVYKVSPFNASPVEAVTLPVLGGGGTELSTSAFHVRRDENTTDPTLREVNPQFDFSASGAFQLDPALYDHTCTSASSNGCPNQGFDAVNVYYHLASFHEKLESLFTTLGSTGAITGDPLDVIVNSLGTDLDGDGDGTNDTNNAAYVFGACRDDDTSMDRCLLFLRPENEGSTKLYHTAREAVVVVHEYQHYVTDQIAGLIPGADGATVGDALHEGYSDYMAASHISDTAGRIVTKVGEYAFQDLDDANPPIIRDIGTIKVYDPDNLETAPHVYGWSFASGLWALRLQLGQEAADLIALKSLFLLPVEPGFMDAVEALVQADKVLFAGQNASAIRSTFYDEVRFLGGRTGQFRDVDNAILELGLRSCAASSRARHPATPAVFFALLLLWAVVALALGRSRSVIS